MKGRGRALDKTLTLAGLIPAMLSIAAVFCIWCNSEILSCSSFAVVSAAMHTASPLLRPFTSAALIAVTSLAPHTLRGYKRNVAFQLESCNQDVHNQIYMHYYILYS